MIIYLVGLKNMNKTYFVVSDVHGFYSVLMKTLEDKGFDIYNPNHVLAICGDLFDRGEEALELYNFIKSLPENRFIYIRGNHEDLLFDLIKGIKNHKEIGFHHYTNGTLDTVCQLCNIDPHTIRNNKLDNEIVEKMSPILTYINNKTVDYSIIGNNILVHGWVPVIDIGNNKFKVNENWDKPKSNDPKDIYKYNQCWKDARWYNGMEKWYLGAKIPNYNIICGHWHCSWGWSCLRMEREEFPEKEQKDWKKSFEPFIDDGIIAIDACTTYSKIINCIMLED